MNKLVLAICVVFSSLVTIAQNAIPSPLVNNDGSVTFRLYAPVAKEVAVTGDFLPKRVISTALGEAESDGVASLTANGDGMWEYTTEPLSSEFYTYNFLVDGMRITDPGCVYTVRDIASTFNTFIIPGSPGSLYSVGDVPHGSITKVWYDSPSLDMNRRVSVYTPAGYETSDTRYPVLYLLHGSGGDEEAWLTLGRAAQILDNMIASGAVKPMIVVFPNGNASQDAAPGETHYGQLTPTTRLPKTMDGSFETSFPELVSFIDNTYRTLPEKQYRAIAGLSMGGFHSYHISKEYPEMFDFVGLFSAAVRPMSDISEIYKDNDAKLHRQFEANPKLYWIGIGEKDFLYDINVELRKNLDANGYPYTYYETGDGHVWRNWRIYLSKFLPLLF